jgi:hypothetical protein
MKMESIRQTNIGCEVWSVYDQGWIPVAMATDADLAALSQGEIRERAIAERERARAAAIPPTDLMDARADGAIRVYQRPETPAECEQRADEDWNRR